MTNFHRAAIVAASSLGIFGLGAASTPGQAVQAASGVVVAEVTIPQLFQVPATGSAITSPSAAAVSTTARSVAPAADNAIDTAAANLTDAPLSPDSADQDAPEFQSLAAAVAGQNAPGDLSNELKCLAGAIYYESKGEPLAGQLAVAEVIINRSRSGRFPSSMCGVVTQAGQFSFVRGGAIPAINPASSQWKTALAVAQVALNEAWESPASEALFFHARYVRPGWGKPRLASIGNHVFYR